MADSTPPIARRYSVKGRVQGVGYRDFVQREARRLELTGYVRNVSDGSVLVCAVGAKASIDQLESALHKGPRWSEVRGVSLEDIEDLEVSQAFHDFLIFP